MQHVILLCNKISNLLFLQKVIEKSHGNMTKKCTRRGIRLRDFSAESRGFGVSLRVMISLIFSFCFTSILCVFWIYLVSTGPRIKPNKRHQIESDSFTPLFLCLTLHSLKEKCSIQCSKMIAGTGK